jgi:D-inositol-3-phosphate glycosyltransferase
MGTMPPDMPVRNLAILSLHTSPLAQPGTGDGGGMNVYVRSLASALARAGVSCDVYTRLERPGQPATVVLEPGLRVIHVPAGPLRPLAKEELPALLPAFTDAMLDGIARCRRNYELFHANYWLSGEVAHALKHELVRPLVSTFHTLARVKDEAGAGDPDCAARAAREDAVVRCSDLIVASANDERDQLVRLYDADPTLVEVIPPGVDHRVFTPDGRETAKRALGLEHHRVLLFVGRIQPLKGADLALCALAQLADPTAVLLIVGGPSGSGGEAELDRLHTLARDLGIARQVRFIPPRQHEHLAAYYRAADVCLVPSHSESFGLVALEAAACGTPVVASSVGGLRGLVDNGVTGFLVDSRDPTAFAAPVAEVLADADRAAAMGAAGASRSMQYSWSMTAARLRRLYGDLVERSLVECR